MFLKFSLVLLKRDCCSVSCSLKLQTTTVTRPMEQRKVASFSLHLQVSALRLEPVLDELLRIVAEAQHEVPLRLQLVDVLDCLVDLR